RWFDGCEIHVDQAGVVALAGRGHPEQTLRLEVSPHRVDVVCAPAGRQQIPTALLVEGEVADGRAVLGRHVPQRGAIRYGEAGSTLAVELDELADDAGLPQ